MPTEARLYASIWRDEDFIALPAMAQRAYFFLISQLDTSLCGVVVMRGEPWASKAAGLTAGELRRDFDVLAERRFVVIDDETGELLVRARIRRDEVLAGPKLIKPLARACSLVESGKLRAAIAAELRRCHAEGLVNPRIEDQVVQLWTSLEHSSQYVTSPLFPASPQVDTLSDTLRHTVSDTVPDTPKGIGDRGKGSRGGPGGEAQLALLDGSPPVPASVLGTDRDPGWVRFWAVYPRRVSKGDARKAWAKAVTGGQGREPADPEIIIKGAHAYAAARTGQPPRYTCHPATWLNRERWNDDPAALAGASLADADVKTLGGMAMADEYRAAGD
jgi:hypothetical protein